jgi:hypothetical protein
VDDFQRNQPAGWQISTQRRLTGNVNIMWIAMEDCHFWHLEDTFKVYLIPIGIVIRAFFSVDWDSIQLDLFLESLRNQGYYLLCSEVIHIQLKVRHVNSSIRANKNCSKGHR